MIHDAEWRKQRPLVTGVLDYFPDALLEVAHCSYVGNEQHNPGAPLHWDRAKSTDEADALGRHLLQRGTVDTDGVLHSAKVAWRALAALQKEIEAAHVSLAPRPDGAPSGARGGDGANGAAGVGAHAAGDAACRDCAADDRGRDAPDRPAGG